MDNNIYITNFWWAANYGAVLTNYALETILQEYNYNAINTDNSDYRPLLWEIHKYFNIGK